MPLARVPVMAPMMVRSLLSSSLVAIHMLYDIATSNRVNLFHAVSFSTCFFLFIGCGYTMQIEYAKGRSIGSVRVNLRSGF